MEGNMWTSATLGLLLCWMMPVDSVAGVAWFTKLKKAILSKKAIKLTMVENSVDDMYLGCNEQMMTEVKDKFLPEEISENNFGKHWRVEESRAEDKFNQRADEALTIDHIRAICVYTKDGVYAEFNTAVRTKGSSYLSSFEYHSFHYLLTSAIQILNNNRTCYSTFRRTHDLFDGTVDQTVRFGSFASSSIRSDLKHFGTKTCFIIKTCLGASLKEYPVFGDEEEVLIPPYETFKITKIIRGQNTFPRLEDCEVVFVLVSAGVMSSVNCNAVDKLVTTVKMRVGGDQQLQQDLNTNFLPF